MAISTSVATTTRATMELTREHIVRRLLTTTEDGSGPTRKDVSILSFGGFDLDKEHHLESIHLLVSSGISSQRFRDVVEERLSGDYGHFESFKISAREDTSSPFEVQLLSTILVRLWYLRSPDVQSVLARLLPSSKLFLDLSEIEDKPRTELDAAIESVSSGRFMHYYHDSRTRLADHMGQDGRTSFDRDINAEPITDKQSGALKIGFRRKVPVFDPLEVLDLDQKAADYGSLIHPSQPSQDFQPRRWRSRHTQNDIYYILPASDSHAGPAAEQKTCALLGAVSAEWSQVSTHDVDMSELEADYGISYNAGSNPKPAEMSDAHDQGSSGPLPPADKVFHRIRWDDSFNQDDIEIQYLDRHEGLMKKPFTEWLRDTEDEEFVPMHRIRAFVRRSDGFVLWDRVKRIHRLGRT